MSDKGEETQQKVTEEILSIEPKTSTENILFFLAISGMILILGGFWKVESILWNRIKYSTGSLWQNNQPEYGIGQGWTLTSVKNLLIVNYIIYLIGIVLLLIVSGYLLKLLIFDKKWGKKTKILTISCVFFSGFASFTSSWIFGSISVISNLESINEEEQNGFDWIRTDLRNLSKLIEVSVIIFLIFFLIMLIISSYFLILKQEKEEKKFYDEKQSFLDIIGSVLKGTPFYVILFVYLIFTLFPVYLVIKVSLSTSSEITRGLFPRNAIDSLILNYSSVMFAVSMDEPSFSRSFLNSIIIGFGTGVLGLTVSVSAAYALARFKFKGNKFLTFLILATQMFPGIILLLPQYVIWTNFGLVNKLSGLLLASAAGSSAYCTWMMKGYFETIPLDIEEAATIDGSTRLGNFTKIAFPLAKSGLVAVLIFTFLTSWQDFVLARTFLRDTEKYTLPLLADNYENSATLDAPPYFELLAPYAILVALPVVLFFIFMQKDLAKGAIAGSVK